MDGRVRLLLSNTTGSMGMVRLLRLETTVSTWMESAGASSPTREGMDRCDRVEWKCALLPLDRPEDEPWGDAGVIGAVPSVKRGFTVTWGGFRTVTTMEKAVDFYHLVGDSVSRGEGLGSKHHFALCIRYCPLWISFTAIDSLVSLPGNWPGNGRILKIARLWGKRLWSFFECLFWGSERIRTLYPPVTDVWKRDRSSLRRTGSGDGKWHSFFDDLR